VTSRPAHRHPAWFDRPAHRLRLIAELRAVGADVAVVRPGRGRRGGFAVRVVLTPTGLEPQRVTIEFGPSTPDTPAIYVPGPGSKHRYNDGSLCIWYPYDPPERRWTWRDGGAVLAGHICAHLIREAWWRETGEWPGEEAPHDPHDAPTVPRAARRTSP
jgi:hypothetical protein